MNSKKLFIYGLITFFLPATKFFGLKSKLLRWCGAEIGENVRIVSSARFQIGGKLIIGNNTWIGHEVLIVGGNSRIEIGNDCDIAPRVTIITGSHKVNSKNDIKVAGEGYSKDIYIGNGCWICTNVTILGGTKIGCMSLIGANTLVKKDIGEFKVYTNEKMDDLR